MPNSTSPASFRPSWWGGALLLSALVLVLAVLPPFVNSGLRAGLMEGFHLLCHQLPERSLAVGGTPFALCHRCFGILIGLVGGVLLLPTLGARLHQWARQARRLLLVAAIPLVIDWSLGALGLWANTPVSRVLTGFLFGFAAGMVLARAIGYHPISPTPEPVGSFSSSHLPPTASCLPSGRPSSSAA